jgi:hypothetical protein
MALQRRLSMGPQSVKKTSTQYSGIPGFYLNPKRINHAARAYRFLRQPSGSNVPEPSNDVTESCGRGLVEQSEIMPQPPRSVRAVAFSTLDGDTQKPIFERRR